MNNKEILKEANRVLNVELKGIESLSKNLDANFIKLVKGIMNTTGRVIVTGMGKSGHVANKIAATLASTGTPAFFVHPAEAGHGDLGMIAKGDCILALSNSGESDELNEIINYTKRYSVPIYSITSNSSSILFKKSTVGIVLRKAIEKGGSSIRDFKNTSGDLGSFQKNFNVYQRENKKCLKYCCKGTIHKKFISNRSSFFCNLCQK